MKMERDRNIYGMEAFFLKFFGDGYWGEFQIYNFKRPPAFVNTSILFCLKPSHLKADISFSLLGLIPTKICFCQGPPKAPPPRSNLSLFPKQNSS